MGGEALIEADAVGRRFGDVVAIDSMSFSIPAGSLTSVIGPSGSGKTTLIRLILGILAPTSGSMTTWQTKATDLEPWQRRRLGYLPQLPALVPELSLIENLRFYAAMAGLGPSDHELHEALAAVDLADDDRTRVSEASGGMQRRLGLAAALVHDPELIVLDEPTAGLDPVLRAEVWEQLRALQEEGRSLVVTTQYVGEAANCDRVLLVREGILVFDDTPISLRRAAYGGDVVEIKTVDLVRPVDVEALEALDGVRGDVELRSRTELALIVDDGPRAIPLLSDLLDGRGVSVDTIAERVVDFDEAFVRIVSSEDRS